MHTAMMRPCDLPDAGRSPPCHLDMNAAGVSSTGSRHALLAYSRVDEGKAEGRRGGVNAASNANMLFRENELNFATM